MAITAATPMMIPSMVSAERSLLALSALSAISTVALRFISSSPPSKPRAPFAGASERLPRRTRRNPLGNRPHNHLLAFLQTSASYFREHSIADPQRHRHSGRLAVLTQHPHGLRTSGLPLEGIPLPLLSPGRRIRRTEAQGRIGYLKRVITMIHEHLHVRRHPGEQLEVWIRHRDDCVIRNHVLHVDRGFPYLDNVAVKTHARIGVDRECGVLADLDATDIGFIHIRVDLHFSEVLRDLEQRRSL